MIGCMLRLRLTTDERTAVQALRRDRTLTPAERDRVEMVCLADTGWGAPAIAAHLGYNPVTVRRLLRRFPDTGVVGLRRKPPGPPPNAARRRTVRTLRHKQDPAKVERAEAVLGSLTKRPPPAAAGSSTSTNAASAPASR